MSDHRPFLALVAVALMTLGVAAQDIEAARRLHADGQYDEALIIYEKLMAGEATYDHVMGVATSLFGLGENSRSDGLFVKAARIDPTRHEPVMYQALILEQKGRAARARGENGSTDLVDAAILFGDAADRAEDPYELRFWAAECRAAAGDLDRAVDEARASLAARPGDVHAGALLTRLLVAAGRLDEAVREADAVLERHPAELPTMRARLEALARLGREAEASAALLAIVDPKAYPRDVAAYSILHTCWSVDRPEVLGAVMKRAVARNPEDPIGLFFLGDLARMAGRFEDALTRFEAYLVHVPDDLIAACHIVQCHLGAGRVARAHELVREAVVRAPGHEFVRGRVREVVATYVQDKAFDRALSLQQVLVSAAPDDVAVARDRAILLKEIGRLDESAAQMALILEREDLTSERRASYMNDLALCHRGRGLDEEAEQVLRAAIEVDAGVLDASENLAVLLAAKGRVTEAMAVLDAVMAIDPLRERTRYWRRRLRASGRR